MARTVVDGRSSRRRGFDRSGGEQGAAGSDGALGLDELDRSVSRRLTRSSASPNEAKPSLSRRVRSLDPLLELLPVVRRGGRRPRPWRRRWPTSPRSIPSRGSARPCPSLRSRAPGLAELADQPVGRVGCVLQVQRETGLGRSRVEVRRLQVLLERLAARRRRPLPGMEARAEAPRPPPVVGDCRRRTAHAADAERAESSDDDAQRP